MSLCRPADLQFIVGSKRLSTQKQAGFRLSALKNLTICGKRVLSLIAVVGSPRARNSITLSVLTDDIAPKRP
jgi:hypothetical protein